MFRTLSLLFFFLVTFSQLKSQIFPKEGSELHYTLIGFSFPTDFKQKNKLVIEIATGNHYTEDSFNAHIVKTLSCTGNKVIAEVPSFGSNYTWRTVYIGDNTDGGKSKMYHFSTIASPEVDTSNIHLRILHSATKYKDAFVFLDGNMVLYDMEGHPVWDFPEDIKKMGMNVRDLKITPYGTITFLSGDNAYEVNYNGDILWKAPNNGIVSGENFEHYHHEFTRFSNGHYMVLGSEFVDMPSLNDSTTIIRMPFGTLIEYDKDGNVIWSWKSSKYYKESDLVNYRPPDGAAIVDLHENAFYFDEKDKTIYISFKNVSRIIKVKYPEGNILNMYGEIYKRGVPEKGNGIFCGQHACKYSQIGCLFLYNNNGCNKGLPPKVKILQESLHEKENVKKVWEYECTVEGNYSKESQSGGNVIELPDHSVFVSMSGVYSKVFIVNKDKQILWSAIAEKWYPSKQTWDPINQYRASIIINQKKLERLIWNHDLNKE